MRDLQDILATLGDGARFVQVTLIKATGSTPREVGAAMYVTESQSIETIGGGALELDAIEHARSMLQSADRVPWRRDRKSYPLGPTLGQCCGGYVEVLFELIDEDERASFIGEGAKVPFVMRPTSTGGEPIIIEDWEAVQSHPHPVADVLSKMNEQTIGAGILIADPDGSADWYVQSRKPARLPICLYGAGHVGRELVRIAADMDLDIVWIDTDTDRFPDALPKNVNRMVLSSPEKAVRLAPPDACHIVMTYSHAMDLDIVHAVLKRDAFRHLGLIGSATKRARFEKRLIELGINANQLSRLACPIGFSGLSGKSPSVVALSVVTELMMLLESKEAEPTLAG